MRKIKKTKIKLKRKDYKTESNIYYVVGWWDKTTSRCFYQSKWEQDISTSVLLSSLVLSEKDARIYYNLPNLSVFPKLPRYNIFISKVFVLTSKYKNDRIYETVKLTKLNYYQKLEQLMNI